MDLLEALLDRPHTPDLGFGVEEYRCRVGRVQQAMREDGIDVLLVSNVSNLSYLTGYDSALPSGYAIGVLPDEGELALHCSTCEAVCALESSTIRDIRLFNWHEGGDTGPQLASMLLERGYESKRIGVETRNLETFATGAMDAASFEELKRRLPGAELVDASDTVMQLRAVKSAGEIAHMKRAARYTRAGMSAGVEAAGDGVGDNECVAAVHQALIAAGSETTAINPLIMSGPRTGWIPHAPHRRQRMQEGDAVFLEVSGSHYRYHAPAMRSVAIGHATSEVARLADVAIASVESTIANIRPGRTGDDVAGASGGALAGHPEIYFFGAYGYSIGLGQSPTWTEAPMYLAEGVETELEPGMCFHVATCIFIPRVAGVGFSRSVAVTESGCELLDPTSDLTLHVR